ncbi:soluble calcium-activated nucleotidase 1 [Homalodisca vitripennis]|uniref:Apyrase n=1 Tax=Homalodisca liturata TaxID=320908 RepID=A0A1B6HNX9_9HEMI|nr:soluble calcium-activated nucleotidase 1 [Homalodisca vitripennis]KAG8242986.1 Soluble calcium-activated nucleotidase 1 [Homalodisca vitripennis]
MRYQEDEEMIMSLKDWRQALRTPPTYRVGNSTLRIQTTFVTIIALLGLFILLILYTTSKKNPKIVGYGLGSNDIYRNHYFPQPHERLERITRYDSVDEYYNATYPLTPPINTPSGVKYRIGIISDLDTNSKSKLESNTWISYFKTGHLMWLPSTSSITVVWDRTDPIELKSTFGQSGRGMELSELVVFNGKLLSFDDRTGLIYEINLDSNIAIPWVLLIDGNGMTTKGYKSEWATVKGHKLYVGSMGKEWTTSGGELQNLNPMWVKVVTTSGQVTHLNWEEQYKTLRRAVGVEFPGYVIHESGVWSEVHQRWFFLPRRLSKKRYNDETDEFMSTNILLSTDQHFSNVQVTYIGEVIPTHGYSSFKFLPATDDSVIIALKSEEDKGRSATYITAFHIDGKILLPEIKVADLKYEGIEFI